MQALFDKQLEVTGKELREIGYTLDFITWISASDFRRLQLPEPIVGGSADNLPAGVEERGIKGKSIYTALYNNTDMETFACKLCPHIVKDDLEDAITHQRIDHFGHYPFQCPAPNTQW